MGKSVAIIKFIIGLLIIVLGALLIWYFWKDFLVMLKGIVGIIVAFIGLIITMIGYFDLKE